MHFVSTRTAWSALALAHYAFGQDIALPAEGKVLACEENGCAGSTCPSEFELGDGYPNCVIYQSADVFAGHNFAAEKDGYDVWWNSNEMDEGCRLIVRTPANVEVQNCGYYLTGWHNKGCYKTHLRNSFNLQFCCGSGDCDKANEANNMAQARVLALQGGTASTSLGSFVLNGTGKRDIADGIAMHWAPREPSSPSQLAKRKAQQLDDIAENKIARERTAAMSPAQPQGRSLAKRTCSTYTEDKQYTERGEQRRISQDIQCADGDCSVDISTSVTEGRSISVGASAELYEVISISTSIEFSEETTRTVTYHVGYKQDGYVSWAPKLLCTRGTVSDCGDDDLNDGDEVEACTPQFFETEVDGETFETIDGEYSFVINQPGAG